MPNVRRCLIVAAVSVALSGCPSLSMLSRPRTVPRGEQEVAVAVAYDAVGAPYLAKNGGQLEIGYRRGLGERNDGSQGDDPRHVSVPLVLSDSFNRPPGRQA